MPTKAKSLTPNEAWEVASERISNGRLLTEEFQKAFLVYAEYRSSKPPDGINKPMTKIAVKILITKIEREDWSHDDAISSFEQSISNTWTGLFAVGATKDTDRRSKRLGREYTERHGIPDL